MPIDEKLKEEAAKTLADLPSAKKDAESFFKKHKTIVIIGAAVVALVIVVFAIL